MTAKDITEKAARIAYPTLPDVAIERIAVAIWNASPTGELYHVQDLQQMMNDPNKLEHVAAYTKSIRNVEAVAAEWTS